MSDLADYTALEKYFVTSLRRVAVVGVTSSTLFASIGLLVFEVSHPCFIICGHSVVSACVAENRNSACFITIMCMYFHQPTIGEKYFRPVVVQLDSSFMCFTRIFQRAKTRCNRFGSREIVN